MEKASLLEIAPQGREVAVAPVHVAVTGHIDVGDVPQVVVAQGDDLFLGGNSKRGASANGGEQIGQAGWIGVPVTSPIVVQPSDGHDWRRSHRGARRAGEEGQGQKYSGDHGNSITSL